MITQEQYDELKAERDALELQLETAQEDARQQRDMKAKAREQRDTLAAHNQTLVSVLGRMVERFELHNESSEIIKRAIQVLEATPQACLAEIRAEAVMGFAKYFDDSNFIFCGAREYAAIIRQGGE